MAFTGVNPVYYIASKVAWVFSRKATISILLSASKLTVSILRYSEEDAGICCP